MAINILPNWHPVFVHFTVGLLFMAVFLFFAATAIRREPLHGQLATAARWNLWLGVLITVGTVIAGFFAFNSVDHGGDAHLPMLSHRNWALSTVPLFVLLAVWSMHPVMRKGDFVGWPHGIFLVLLAIAGMMLMATGYKGGELVFRYGVGVMLQPSPDQGMPEIATPMQEQESGHHHDHGDHQH